MDKFEEIYKTYFKKIYFYLKTISRNNMISEDIAQDTFYKAFQYILVNKDVHIDYSWFVTVARNLYIDYIRKNKKNRNLIEIPDKCNLITEFELKADIAKALEYLPIKYKDLILLKYYFGFTSQEISHILNASDAAVRTMLVRAKKKFKEVYQNNEK